jgi:nucleoside-diphosphate-sugar epimerase
MRIAVTGAAGYIGGWLTQVLAERGHEVCTQDVVPGPGVDRVFDLGITPVRRHWLASKRPGVVIHLAALYGRVWGERDMIKTAGINAGLTAELARDVAARGARLMFMSSSEVYGSTASLLRGEILASMPLVPLNMYGLSKKWGEEACRTYAPDGLVITRLNMPYGPAAVFPQSGVVPHHSGRAGNYGYNALHTMLWQAHHSLPITVHRECERSFTWVRDSCTALAMIAESGRDGTWNVCRNDDHIAMSELARRCVALVPGCTSDITEKEPDDQITLRKVLDSDALWKLGWRPEVDLETGLKETLGYVAMFDQEGRWRGDAH